jgi:hypothetical protein
MDGGNEQSVTIKLCFRASLSSTEILVLVQKAYGNEAVNRSNLFGWYSRSLSGRELVEFNESDDRPKSTRTEINITVVADLFKNERQIAPKMITEALGIHKTSNSHYESFGKRRTYLELTYTKHMRFHSVLFLIYSLFFKHFQLYKQIIFRA